MSPDLNYLIEIGIVPAENVHLLYNADTDKLRKHLIEKIKSILTQLEENHKDLKSDDEETLTGHIARALNQSAMFNATAETNSNGHVDITVTAHLVNQLNFKVKGEAKIWKDNSYALKGYTQLDGYLTGRPNVAIFLYYFRSGTCDEKFKAYIDHLISKVGGSKLAEEGRFSTTSHTHTSSAKIEIDHYCAWLPK